MTTETMPTTAPVETVTPIRPSEAIRLGCLIAPVQTTGSFFDGKGGACALGAMVLGLGYDGPRLYMDDMPNASDPYMLIEAVLPGRVISEVYRRNDGLIDGDEDWSRERIADWLAEQGL